MLRTGTMKKRMVDVLLLAGTASSTTLTLSSFEALSSLSLPLGCIAAYNTPILGCSLGEIRTKVCSRECRESLKSVEIKIQASCTLVSVGLDTLFRQGQNGSLVDALCRGNVDGKSTTTTRTQPPSSNRKSFTRIPPDPATTTTPSTRTRESISANPDPTSTASTSTASTSSTPVTMPTPTVTGGGIDSTTTSPPTPGPPSSKAPASTSKRPPRQTLLPGSGGGSPFDFVAAHALGRRIPSSAVVVAVGCMALIVAR
ncbi:hypothetical protein RJ55_07584 [Drechmeria coniospora]|nr:hypothetical protein RJ55_07584 [Drechmeria coniospora]